jgi:hypothetical protein
MELSSSTKKILLGTTITLGVASLGYFIYKFTTKSPKSKKLPQLTSQYKNPKKQNDTSQMSKHYINYDLGISFQHPPSWNVLDVNTEPTMNILHIAPPNPGITITNCLTF